MTEVLKVVTTAAMKGVFGRLAQELIRATGIAVALDFAPPLPAAQRIRNGDAADVLISTPDAIAALVRKGKIDGGSHCGLHGYGSRRGKR